MLHCDTCGTTWLARSLIDDPYRRGGFPRPSPAEVSDAIVLDEVRAGFATAAPSRRPLPPPMPPRRPAVNRGWVKGLGVVLAIVTAAMVLRAPIVAALPQVNGLPPEVDKLAFQRVHSETVARNGVRTLVVEGEIVNRSGAAIAVPAIRISLRSPAGQEVYSWLVEPTADGIAPGRTIGFRSAVPSPPADATQVTLKLAQRTNLIVGMR